MLGWQGQMEHMESVLSNCSTAGSPVCACVCGGARDKEGLWLVEVVVDI